MREKDPRGNILYLSLALIKGLTHVSKVQPTFAAMRSIHSATKPQPALISSQSTTGRPPNLSPLIVPTLIELAPACVLVSECNGP